MYLRVGKYFSAGFTHCLSHWSLPYCHHHCPPSLLQWLQRLSLSLSLSDYTAGLARTFHRSPRLASDLSDKPLDFSLYLPVHRVLLGANILASPYPLLPLGNCMGMGTMWVWVWVRPLHTYTHTHIHHVDMVGISWVSKGCGKLIWWILMGILGLPNFSFTSSSEPFVTRI